MRVLFYAQYLKGIGHVVRAKRIAEELISLGAEVTLVLGGPVMPGFQLRGGEVLQLPPVMAGTASYSKLHKPDGETACSTYLDDRRSKLLSTFSRLAPHVLITEAFPMGRWAMRFELEPLLEQTVANSRQPRPLVVASLRDILQMPKTLEKVHASMTLFERYYDEMLIHGDPRLVAIEDSFPPLARFLDRAHYTGIVAPEAVHLSNGEVTPYDVVVSGGGGAIGFDILAAAIAAKPSTSLAGQTWLALAGHRMPDAKFAKLGQLARENGVELQRFRDDLAQLIAGARLSIQRAGYNTIADLLRSKCRAVLVPDAANRQMEQPLRAKKLEEAGRAVVVREEGLSAGTMASGIEKAMASEPAPLELDLNGAVNSARTILDLWRRHQLSQNAGKTA